LLNIDKSSTIKSKLPFCDKILHEANIHSRDSGIATSNILVLCACSKASVPSIPLVTVTTSVEVLISVTFIISSAIFIKPFSVNTLASATLNVVSLTAIAALLLFAKVSKTAPDTRLFTINFISPF